jgi:hypothetical protein
MLRYGAQGATSGSDAIHTSGGIRGIIEGEHKTLSILGLYICMGCRAPNQQLLAGHLIFSSAAFLGIVSVSVDRIGEAHINSVKQINVLRRISPATRRLSSP